LPNTHVETFKKTIGVAEWKAKLVHSLPVPLKCSLPPIEQIEGQSIKRRKHQKGHASLFWDECNSILDAIDV